MVKGIRIHRFNAQNVNWEDKIRLAFVQTTTSGRPRFSIKVPTGKGESVSIVDTVVAADVEAVVPFEVDGGSW